MGHPKFTGHLYDDFKNEQERYDSISNWAMNVIAQYPDVKKVYIEDYAFAASGRIFNIAENTEVLKYKLWKANIEIVPVPPTVIKKFYAGKGDKC